MTLSGLAEAERVQPPRSRGVVDVLVTRGLRDPHPERRRPPGRVGRADRRRPRARRDASAVSANVYLAQRLRTFTAEDRADARAPRRRCSNGSPRIPAMTACAGSATTRSRRCTIATTASTSSARRSPSVARGCSGSRRRCSSSSSRTTAAPRSGSSPRCSSCPMLHLRRVGRRHRRPLRQAQACSTGHRSRQACSRSRSASS